MKKFAILIGLAIVTAGTIAAQNQGAATGTTTAAPATTQPAATPAASAATPAVAALAPAPAEGKHYLVRSSLGPDRQAKLLARLEGLFELFNRLFRFDDARLPGKLVVHEFDSKANFDAYLLQAAGETRGDFVYLHFPSAQKRELLLYPKDGREFSASLAHQAFVQFLKAFIREPPLWMRDGFAVYFENVTWNEARGSVVALENLAWLETVKSLKAKGSLITLERLLTAGPEEARSAVEVFYPESWAFVSFLADGKAEDFGRLLWETLVTLGPDATLEDNQRAFQKRLVDWYGMAATEKAFAAYIDERRTYPELVALGIDRFGKKEFDNAARAFGEAASLDPMAYVPPYYLGLVAYSKGQYAEAETLFRAALDRGCDLATATYALGLNAIARGLNDEGAAILAQAAAASPDRYKVKVEEILKRLGK
jgi:tetratricopeptide (TPR) repeat protein